MRYDHKFGEIILENKTTVRRVFGMRFWYSLAILFFVISGIALIVNFGFSAEVFVVLLFIVPFTAFCFYKLLRYAKYMTAVLYEFGLKHYSGRQVTEILFNDVKSIDDETLSRINYGARPGARIYTERVVTIVKKDGTRIKLYPWLVPNHEKFFPALKTQFEKYGK